MRCERPIFFLLCVVALGCFSASVDVWAASAAAPHGAAERLGRHFGADAWFAGTCKPPKGDVWEHGVSGKTLARKRAFLKNARRGVNTQGAIDWALREISSYERGPDTLGGARLEKADAKLRGRVSSEEATWRNPVTEPMRVDQGTLLNSRSIVGAYADVVRDEDFQMSVGPELIVDNEAMKGGTSQYYQSDAGNGLGVGMQFQWAF